MGKGRSAGQGARGAEPCKENGNVLCITCTPFSPIMTSSFIFYTGRFTCRLHSNCRLNLPRCYELARHPIWFLVPSRTTPTDKVLSLYPGTMAFMQRAIKQATGTEITFPAVDDAISALNIITMRIAMDPELVCAWVPRPRSNHLTLSQAQVKWLNETTRNRSMKLNGVLTCIQIRPTETWARMHESFRHEHLRKGNVI